MNKIVVCLVSLAALVALVCNPYGYEMFELPKVHFLMIFSGIVLFVGSLVAIFNNKTIDVKYNKYVTITLILWILSLLISTIFSIFPQLSFWGSYERLQGLYSYFSYIILFLTFLHVLSDQRSQEIFMKITITIGIIASIHSILQQFGIAIFVEDSMNTTVQRSFATMGNPNFLAQFLIFPLWMSLYFLIKNKNKSRILYGMIIVLILAGILLTKSRASILGIIVAGTVLMVFFLKIKKIYKYILILGIFSAFILFVIFVASNMQSLMARFYIWQGTLNIIKDHWLIGSGLETFKAVFQKVQLKELLSVEEMYSIADRAHNGILDLFITQGVIGVAVYLSIIGGVFSKVIYKIKGERIIVFTLSAALMSSIVANLFSFYVATDCLMLSATVAIILNNTVNFKTIKLEKKPLIIFVAGIIFALSGIMISWGSRAIYADTIYFRGLTKIYQANLSEGIIDISNAVNLNPQQSGATLTVVRILEIVGEEDANPSLLRNADTILEEYAKITGKDFQYYFEKGEIYTLLAQYDLAEQYYGKANELAPYQPIIIRQWGIMLYKKGDYKESIVKLEKFLNIIPPYWQWKNEIDKKSYNDKEKFRLFFKEKQDFWGIFIYLSEDYQKLGDQTKAEYYSQFIDNKKEDTF
ncbi:MAG: O-antigen ligase family protein [Candidatus Gracilibacteria bacterium]